MIRFCRDSSNGGKYVVRLGDGERDQLATLIRKGSSAESPIHRSDCDGIRRPQPARRKPHLHDRGSLAGGIVGAGGELSWPAPTRPGDVLHVECEVVEITPSRSRPDGGHSPSQSDDESTRRGRSDCQGQTCRSAQSRELTAELSHVAVLVSLVRSSWHRMGVVTLSNEERERPASCIFSSDRDGHTPRVHRRRANGSMRSC